MNTSQSVSNSDLTLVKLSPQLDETRPQETATEQTSINPRPKISKTKPNLFIRFIRDYYRYFQALLISILIAGLKASGPIPRHVAIIMDGNRRYAKKKGFLNVSEGHFEGAKTLEKMLDYGFRLGVKSVTVYAFSIENFKRPAEEVDVLMSLAAERLQILSQKSDLIKRHRVRINVLGAIEMLPRHVRISAAEAMLSTINHENFVLNICFPYTSTHEISEACKSAIDYTRSIPNPLPIFENTPLFDCFLDTWDSPPLEILIRTSGEARLSEFLMWQVSKKSDNVQVHILDALWPEFGFSHLLPIVMKYQRDRKLVKSSTSQNPLLERDLNELKEWRRKTKLIKLKEIVEGSQIDSL